MKNTGEIDQIKEGELTKIKPNIVIMGGSFNPPTIAHLRIMQTALDTLRAEAGYFVPVSFPYLKRKMIRAGTGHLCLSDNVRLAMLRAMCAEDRRLHVDECELSTAFATACVILAAHDYCMK